MDAEKAPWKPNSGASETIHKPDQIMGDKLLSFLTEFESTQQVSQFK